MHICQIVHSICLQGPFLKVGICVPCLYNMITLVLDNKIYNLSYDLQVNYTNESGRLVSSGKNLYDSGVESKYIKVDDVCSKSIP